MGRLELFWGLAGLWGLLPSSFGLSRPFAACSLPGAFGLLGALWGLPGVLFASVCGPVLGGESLCFSDLVRQIALHIQNGMVSSPEV